MSFRIGSREVGGGRCFIIGEVGLAHDGSLQAAHAFVDAIAGAGADAVKFQMHLAAYEPDAPLRVPHVRWRSRHEQWRDTVFLESEWSALKSHVESRGLEFLCSPFSVEAVAILERLGVPAWKIPSGEITNEPLLQAVHATGKPVLVSAGMSTMYEIDEALDIFSRAESNVVLMTCVSLYPCPPEKIGLNRLHDFRRDGADFHGLSDHSGSIWPSIAAVDRGAHVLEVHVKLSQYDQGPDASSSVTPEQLKQLVEGCRFIETMKAHPVDKDLMAKELAETRALFMRKAVTA